jgi:hypothetical protein
MRQNGVFFTEHAVRQMAKRDISDAEVIEAISDGHIIEEYPKDKFGPSCLIYGDTRENRPLHVVCSLPPRVRIITVYEPEPGEWIERRYRRQT